MDFILPCQAKAFLFSTSKEDSSRESAVMNIARVTFTGGEWRKRENPARQPSEALKQKQITRQSRNQPVRRGGLHCGELLGNLNQMWEYSKPVQDFNTRNPDKNSPIRAPAQASHAVARASRFLAVSA
jgi:hypothetical protein